MSFVKWLLALGCVVSAQVVPDWFVLELAESPTERTRGVRRIRDAQARVRQAMTARLAGRVEVKDSTEVVMNALIVQSRAGALELAALPGVRRVWPVYEVHPELDRAVALLQIGKAWEAVGGVERAGAGMKIGILDTGLDLQHPGFQTTTMPVPEGYPRATNEEIRGLLNGKVIVYRTYDQMLGFAESADDNVGHGTAVAMTAAGLRVRSPLGEIQGAAPGAWLGIYKVFVGPNGSANTAIVTKALDDAAADGMDVVNLSLGFLPQVRVEFDPMVPAVERAASLGVTVVKSNGNSGPVRLSGSAPSMGTVGLTVGSSWTDRVFSSGIRLTGADPMQGVSGEGPAPDGPISAPLRDVSAIDSTGLACSPLPAGSLTGAIAFVLRGDCSFESKINNAQSAGAVAVIVYTHAESPDAGIMQTGSATLPAMMIDNRDGVRVKGLLAQAPDSIVEMIFDDSLPFALDADGVSNFSSRGPGADGSIRPDLLAIGEDILTAAQKTNKDGELYDPSGFTITNGTSFSSPLVAGAYAVLKAGRPGLRASQYRSLLVNTALPFPAAESRPAVQVGGAGRLDLNAALHGELVMEPASVSFGLGGQRPDAGRTIRIQNAGASAGTWKLEVDSSDEVKAAVDPTEFSLGASDTIDVSVRFQGDVQFGEYQGFLVFRRVDAAEGNRPQRVAYWYGAPNEIPASIKVMPSAPANAAGGVVVTLHVLITDAIGAGTKEAPKVTVLEGSGEFVEASSEESTFPGYWKILLRMGADSGQANRFRVESGSVVREISLRTR